MPITQRTPDLYRQGANRAVAWLTSQLNQDGSYRLSTQDLACYYKTPYLLFLAGKGTDAHHVLRYIHKTFMTTNGDFTTSPELKSANGALAEYWAYMNGWLAITSQKMGCFTLADPAWTYLQGFFHPATGGGTTHHPYGHGDNTIDALTTAHLGLASLYFGDKKKAVEAGYCLQRFLDLQPRLNQEFLLRISDKGSLISEFPSQQSVLYAVNLAQPNQAYFMLGYPVAFLGKLYEATGDQVFLQAGKDYLDLLLRSTGNIRSFHFSHKVAWGSAIMARITQDRRYIELAENITDYLLSIQTPSGAWLDDQPAFTTFDQTAEIAIWLYEIANELY